MLRFLLIVLAALLPLPAAAQDAAAAQLEGSWALQIDGAAMFRFDLARKGERWSGSWWRPKSFGSDGNTFSRVVGPAVEVPAGEGAADGQWVQVTFPDNRPGAVPDVFRFRPIGPDRVEMVYVDTRLAPFTLVRVAAGSALGPWEEGHVYRRRSVEMLGLPGDAQPLAPQTPVGDPAAGADVAAPPPGQDPPKPLESYTLPPGAKPIKGR